MLFKPFNNFKTVSAISKFLIITLFIANFNIIKLIKVETSSIFSNIYSSVNFKLLTSITFVLFKFSSLICRLYLENNKFYLYIEINILFILSQLLL